MGFGLGPIYVQMDGGKAAQSTKFPYLAGPNLPTNPLFLCSAADSMTLFEHATEKHRLYCIQVSAHVVISFKNKDKPDFVTSPKGSTAPFHCSPKIHFPRDNVATVE